MFAPTGMPTTRCADPGHRQLAAAFGLKRLEATIAAFLTDGCSLPVACCQLLAVHCSNQVFSRFWTPQDVRRTAVHVFTGRIMDANGIAYGGLGVTHDVSNLCRSYANPADSRDYGLSTNIGTFDWDEQQGNNPAAVVFDASTFMHELGHTFGSVSLCSRLFSHLRC